MTTDSCLEISTLELSIGARTKDNDITLAFSQKLRHWPMILGHPGSCRFRKFIQKINNYTNVFKKTNYGIHV